MRKHYILLVEDNPDQLRDLHREVNQVLRRVRQGSPDLNATIVQATSSNELEVKIEDDPKGLGAALASGGKEILAILDHRLDSSDLDGLEIAQMLRSRAQRTTIVAFSTFHGESLISADTKQWKAYEAIGARVVDKVQSGGISRPASMEAEKWLLDASGTPSAVEELLAWFRDEFNSKATSPQLHRALLTAAHAATDTGRWNMLISGPFGCGKDYLADCIWRASEMFSGRGGSKEVVDFGIRDNQAGQNLQAIIFGREAHEQLAPMVGKFQLADTGIVVIQEFGDQHEELQIMLRNAIDWEGARYQVLWGGHRDTECSVIFTTNRPEKIKEDIDSRITYRIELPELSEHLEDVPAILNRMMSAENERRRLNGAAFILGHGAREKLESHEWSHMRQLRDSVTLTCSSAWGDYASMNPSEIQIQPEHVTFAKAGGIREGVGESSGSEQAAPNSGEAGRSRTACPTHSDGLDGLRARLDAIHALLKKGKGPGDIARAQFRGDNPTQSYGGFWKGKKVTEVLLNTNEDEIISRWPLLVVDLVGNREGTVKKYPEELQAKLRKVYLARQQT